VGLIQAIATATLRIRNAVAPTNGIDAGRPKRVFALSAMCLILAIPIVVTVGSRVHDENHAIAAIERERSGLRCGLVADDLLAAIERFRLRALVPPGARGRATARAPDGMEPALRQLETRDCAALTAGPRTSVTALRRWKRIMVQHPDPVEMAHAAVPFADAVLALFLDIDDASGLTYDPTVDAVNLADALMDRIPALTERLEQSAQILELAGRRHAVVRADVVAVEKLSGRAHEISAMANDDFEGALFALPMLRPALAGARDQAQRTASALATRIDRAVAGGGPPRPRGHLRTLRQASISAGQRLLRTAEGVLETSFDARVALRRQTARLTIAWGTIALVAACVIVVSLWQALRRHHRDELQRAHERAQVLETQLGRRNAERALRLTEKQFRAVFDGSNVGIAIVAHGGARIDANPALSSMFDADLAIVLAAATEMFDQVVSCGRDSDRLERCFKKPNGELLWAELSLSIIGGAENDEVSAIVLVHDITEHKTLNARLDYETLHDALTDLPNRVHFIRRVRAMTRTGEGFAVAFIDLDRFKLVNDTLGHQVGDKVLQLAARRLSAAVRPIDFVARLHGDEFAVMFCVSDSTDVGEIDAIVERLHDALEMSIETPTTPIRISASIGCVRDGASYRDPEALLHDADSAMYRAKITKRERTA
jgi:diguanylate cyclase (GGDEF)-like protein